MLLDILQSALQAGAKALHAGPDTSMSVEFLPHKSTHDFSCEHVASGFFTSGPLHRLIIGCGPDACSQAGCAPEKCFASICFSVGSELERQWEIEIQDGEMRARDSGDFRFYAAGMRSFVIRLGSAEGGLFMVLDLDSTADNRDLPWGDSGDLSGVRAVLGEHETDASISDTGKIKTILKTLLEVDADVQIKVLEETSRVALGNGTMIGVVRHEGKPAIALSVPEHVQLKTSTLVGSTLEILFSFRNHLMQFVSTVLGESRVPIGERASLNLLNLSIPKTIFPGQRRGSERIVPTTFITGNISPLEAGRQNIESEFTVPILIKDLSETGARVAMGSNTVLSSFKWGKLIRCQITLPEPFDAIDVPAVIHRLVMLPDEGVRRNVQLGIEFQPVSGDVPKSRSLAPIRHYIQWQKAGCPIESPFLPQGVF